ncbi:NAD(P)-binding domain-containing protein [Geodermatophilus sp. SYSU D01176]
MGIDSAGVIGLGATGSVVARRLLEQGFEVTVHDRDFWKVAVMAGKGARPARIPADAAEPADLVFVHVTDETAAEEVLFDCGGVGETLRDGGFVVLTCRTRGAFVRSVATRLEEFGITTVEASFSGDVAGMSATVLVGCDRKALQIVEPVLRLLAAGVAYTGPVGSVAAMSELLTALSGLPRVPTEHWNSFAGVAPGPQRDVRVPRRRVGTAQPVPPIPSPHAPEVGHGHQPSAPLGVLTLQELSTVVDAARGDGTGERPSVGRGPAQDNCLGLGSRQFEAVIAELERRCHVPLLREALQCRTPGELVALVNTQVTSGV